MRNPEVRYARSGNVSIAYSVFGEGSRDLVVVPGFVSHLEIAWEYPPYARFLERLGSFARVILFDKRETGLSDRTGAIQSLEERMDDTRAVMDAAGSEHATLLGISEGGPLAILFAASLPERTDALVLYGTFARLMRSADHPAGTDPEVFRSFFARVTGKWGTDAGLSSWAPSRRDDPQTRAWWSRFQRLSASPGSVNALMRLYEEIDVRHVLPAIRVPAIVCHRRNDRMVSSGQARYLAEHIPGARYVEIPGEDHFYFTEDVGPMLAEIEELLTGSRTEPTADRALMTILFTDVVASTERASAIGDQRWRDLFAAHHQDVRRALERYRGREIRTTGDGVLATFDGPARAIRCAVALVEAARAAGIEIRAGIHTGEVEVLGDDIAGIAVHTAARVSAKAGAGEVLVSHTVRDLVAGSGIAFENRGTHVLKGVPGEWTLLAVAA